MLNYCFNDGQLRIYTIFATLFGFLFYYFTVGRVTPLLFEGVLFFIRSFLAIAFWILSRPVVLLVGFLVIKIKNIYAKLEKTIAKKQKMVYNIDKFKRSLQDASHGFLTEKI